MRSKKYSNNMSTFQPIVRPIRNKVEFEKIQAELDALIDEDPSEGTAAYDRMELLAILVSAYEAETLEPFEPPPPPEMVKYMAEMKGITAGVLADAMGGRSRLSDFYNGKRPLSTGQIVRLRDLLDIPADLLIGGPRRSSRKRTRAARG